jgi:ABC-2 type transport system ATP-binding protein
MFAVDVENLSHRYGTHPALSDVSFSVHEAEIFALLGPNGGGKTTLFRILSTLFPPSEGTARVFGSDVRTQASEVRRQIGVVFQSPSLDKKLTVMENLTHQAHLYGMRGVGLRTRIQEMMEHLGITDRAGHLVQTLSGGLQRRVELAKGLLHRPRLLILDEPSVGLDPGARHDLWQYLERLRGDQKVTILVTTHLIDEADRSSRVLILDKGKVVASGDPDTLKRGIGGDIIAVTSTDNESLRAKVADKFGLNPTILNGSLRIEKVDGHQFIATLVESFPGMIDSVTLAKPTLEDVFIERTGHRLWEEE